MNKIFEIAYFSNGSFIVQLFSCFRFSMVFGSSQMSEYYSIITFGIWKIDVSLTLEKDKNANNIQEKWTV